MLLAAGGQLPAIPENKNTPDKSPLKKDVDCLTAVDGETGLDEKTAEAQPEQVKLVEQLQILYNIYGK